MSGPDPPTVESETLRRLSELEGKFDTFLQEFHAYVQTAGAERRELRLFIEDDVRGLLAQLAELARNHRSGLADVMSALALHLGGPEQEPPQEPNGEKAKL